MEYNPEPKYPGSTYVCEEEMSQPPLLKHYDNKIRIQPSFTFDS